MTPRRLALLACLALVGCGGGGGGEKERPHIFLITADTLRADHLSVFGHARETSPQLDAFAGRSVHFTDAVTVTPKTGPAFASMFVGHPPRVHGVVSNFEGLPEDLPVLAERLAELGYATSAFVGNPALRTGKGFSRGFGHYEQIGNRQEDGTRSIHEAFLAWAGSHEWTRPTFVWVHYMDPHGPYTPPAELASLFRDDPLAGADPRTVPAPAAEDDDAHPNKTLGAVPAYQVIEGEERVADYVARYDAEIRYMDETFGRMIAFLEERGLFDTSAVLFTSDHGESLGEHDYWFEHGWFAYEPTLHIPLMIKLPGQAEGRVVKEQVSVLDVLPTVLDLAGARAEGLSGDNVTGRLDERAPLLIENSDRYPHKYHGVRISGWKYLRRSADETETEELYDLNTDPQELRNVAEAQPERLAELRAACDRALEQAREMAVEASDGTPDDPATLERLKSLGYVGE